jgi:hypothetical protein
MCTVSMIMQAQQEIWPWPSPRLPLTEASLPYHLFPLPIEPSAPQIPAHEGPTKEQFEEFLSLLREAKRFDEKMGQKDCEMETKKAWLRALAEHLGVSLGEL